MGIISCSLAARRKYYLFAYAHASTDMKHSATLRELTRIRWRSASLARMAAVASSSIARACVCVIPYVCTNKIVD